MPPTTVDALTSFTYLTDNLPKWMTRIDGLSNHVSQKHAEYVQEYARLLSDARPRKQKSPSVHSISSNKDLPPNPPEEPSPTTGGHLLSPTLQPKADPVEISPFEAGNKYLFAQTQRKRKAGSLVRSGASGPQKFRSRHQVVIYYDAYIQEQLEALVKSIGGARNNLRKGKMSRTAATGFPLPSLSRGPEDTYGMFSYGSPRAMPMPTKGPALDPKLSRTSTLPANGDLPFAEADKILEQSQGLCETAAHQILRDGDCALELLSVRRNLETVTSMAESSINKLKAEEEQKQKQPEESNLKIEADNRAGSESDCTLVAETPPLEAAKLAPAVDVVVEETKVPINSAASPDIEVDDDSDASSIVVDITKFRTARNSRLQSPLPA